MKLLPNWREVMVRAWSVRLLFVSLVFSTAEVVLPLVKDSLPIPALTFAALSGIACAGALISRFYVQKGLSGGEQ